MLWTPLNLQFTTCRYIIIQLDGYPAGKISIVDNRHETDIEDLPDVDYSDMDKEFNISDEK